MVAKQKSLYCPKESIFILEVIVFIEVTYPASLMPTALHCGTLEISYLIASRLHSRWR